MRGSYSSEIAMRWPVLRSATRRSLFRLRSLSHRRHQRRCRPLAPLESPAHFLQRRFLELSNPLPIYTKIFPYGFERLRLAIIQPKAHCQDLALALAERRQHFIEEVPVVVPHHSVKRSRCILICHDFGDRAGILSVKPCIQRQRRL